MTLPFGSWMEAEAGLNSSGSIVQFDNVGLRYGTGAETLSDLSFSLREGGFYFLTGPSGAGKTSLLKLLYLALQNIARKWTMPIKEWKAALNRFAIIFEDRMPVL